MGCVTYDDDLLLAMEISPQYLVPGRDFHVVFVAASQSIDFVRDGCPAFLARFPPLEHDLVSLGHLGEGVWDMAAFAGLQFRRRWRSGRQWGEGRTLATRLCTLRRAPFAVVRVVVVQVIFRVVLRVVAGSVVWTKDGLQVTFSLVALLGRFPAEILALALAIIGDDIVVTGGNVIVRDYTSI